VANLRSVVSERQVVYTLGLLFALWLSTTFVRPVMPISIDGFADHSGGQDLVTLHLPWGSWEIDEKLASGLVFAAVGFTSMGAALSIGPVGQRIGYRLSVTLAAAGTGLLFIPVALADSYTGFLVAMAATGLFQGAMVPGTNALIAASTPEGKQGSAFGLAASMQSLALLVGPLAGGAVGGLLGIEWVYAVIAVILVAASVASAILIREPRGLVRR
jgi:MFS family permease